MKVREFAIHPSHRKLAITAHMHMDYKTGRIKVEEIPIRLLESYLKQNLIIIHRLDELRNLSMIAFDAGDFEWQQRICDAIDNLEDDLFIEKGEWK